ncbi:HPr family phosphocarrier protein [Candidatus Omnitrophota bacterium]
MPRVEKKVVIKNKQGLHARPAAMFVQIVSKYDSIITIQKDEDVVNGKSIMGILTLGAQQYTAIKIIAEGEDAQEALNELEMLVSDESIE